MPPGALGECSEQTGIRHSLTVGGTSRPASHWDADLEENLSSGGVQHWKLHLGDSFTDVPRTQPFYAKIETLLAPRHHVRLQRDAVLSEPPGPSGADCHLHRQGSRRLGGERS